LGAVGFRDFPSTIFRLLFCVHELGSSAQWICMQPVATKLLDVPLFAADGSATCLRAFLHSGPLVAVFVRHFG
jgi:hypothetical protein